MSIKDQMAAQLARRDALASAGWHPDPKVPDQLRYWDGNRWTQDIKVNGMSASVDPIARFDGIRWQYGVINIGIFKAMDRMQRVLGVAGGDGWELVTVYDKTSNWTAGEKGFMLFKRAVPEGVKVADDAWCIDLSETL